MKLHAIPFPQLGFGRNGFGVDYGRYNVTLNDADRYKFRTAPLYNVSKTAPYSHSGSIATLSDAVRAHVDPLLFLDPKTMNANDRVEFYNRLRLWAATPLNGVVLSDQDVSDLVAFLETLSYESETPVKVVE